MDAGGEVSAGGGRRGGGCNCWPDEGPQVEARLSGKGFDGPVAGAGGGDAVAQHGSDVNRFAEITAAILAELLHFHLRTRTAARAGRKSFVCPNADRGRGL